VRCDHAIRSLRPQYSPAGTRSGVVSLARPRHHRRRQHWLNIQRGLTRVYRGNLTESYGMTQPAIREQVDALLRVALDL
jgi:hypothetical protein